METSIMPAPARFPGKSRCGVCQGLLGNTTITHQERRQSNLYLFEHVPAQVCADCGEIWIGEKTLQEIDRLIQSGQPTRKQTIPVFDLAPV
jgi:HTH-type transcriptional regulator / antitoxin MqsA